MSSVSISGVKKQFILRKIGHSNILVPLHTTPDAIKTLDDNGLIFWNFISAGDTVLSTSKKIAKYFDISLDIAKNDLKKFLKDLTSTSLDSTLTSFFTSNESSRFPLSGSFEITGKCNLSCFHCYVASEKIKPNLSYSSIKKIIDDLVKNGCLFLLLTGGECTLHPDFAKIYLYARKKGIIVSINTNATQIDDHLLSLFKKFPPLKIRVSLYGHLPAIHDKVTRSPGSFNIIINNCLKLKELGINVSFSGLIFKDTSKYESDLKNFANKLNIPINVTRGLVPTIDNHNEHMEYLDRLGTESCLSSSANHYDSNHVYKCEAGKTKFHIDTNGDLMICMLSRSYKFSIVTQSFSRAWSRLGLSRSASLAMPSGCSSCGSINRCNFCPVVYNLFKSSDVLNIYCKKYETRQTT